MPWPLTKKSRNHLEFPFYCCGPGGVSEGVAIFIKVIVYFLSLSAERDIKEGSYATTVQYYGAPAPMGNRRNHIPWNRRKY